MNTKQVVVLVVGCLAAFAALGACPKSEVVSSRPIGPNMGMIVMEDSVSKAGVLWSGVAAALTVATIYFLRTRRPS